MAREFGPVFYVLRGILAGLAPPLAVLKDSPTEFSLVTPRPSPFPQHRGRPMWFGEVRAGKAHVSLHLMPLYMNTRLQAAVPPGLQKRQRGKTCFHFYTPPDAARLAELHALAAAALDCWRATGWA